MSPDEALALLRQLLARVVDDVIGEDATVTFDVGLKAPHVARARMTSTHGNDRSACIRAAGEWFEAAFCEIGAATTLVDDDWDEAYMEKILRSLALVVRAYLRGEGTIHHRRGLFRKQAVLTIETVDGEWRLAKHGWSSAPYPRDEALPSS